MDAEKLNQRMRRYLAALGKKGGEAGCGKSKQRGGGTRAEQLAYYRRLAKLSAAAKARRVRSQND